MRRQIERTPHEPRGYLPVPARCQKARARHFLRMSRYERVQRLIRQRKYRHIERREIALEIALMTLVTREELRERAEPDAERDKSTVSERLIAESRLTDLRRAYAALGQGRRARMAA
jgi:hypothetical protein